MFKTISCTVDSKEKAEKILNELKAVGFSNDSISVLSPNGPAANVLANETHTKAPEGAATGVSTGGVIGGILGWLVGIGSLAIPGVGPFIAAGPIMAALSGTAVGAAVGGLTGTLVGLGIPEYEAKIYASKLKEGGTLITVHSQEAESEKRTQALEIFKRSAASDISAMDEHGIPPLMPRPTASNSPYEKTMP